MKHSVVTLAVAACFAVTGSAAFAALTKDEYQALKGKIEASAKADRAQCVARKDNARDVCKAEAKAEKKAAEKKS